VSESVQLRIRNIAHRNARISLRLDLFRSLHAIDQIGRQTRPDRKSKSGRGSFCKRDEGIDCNRLQFIFHFRFPFKEQYNHECAAVKRFLRWHDRCEAQFQMQLLYLDDLAESLSARTKIFLRCLKPTFHGNMNNMQYIHHIYQ